MKTNRTYLAPVATLVLAGFGLVAVGGGAAAWADGAVPSLNDGALGQGAFSSMHMLLEKTILKIDVATIDVRVDKKAQARLAELAKGKSYSDGLEKSMADVAINAERAVVQMKFVRDVPLNRWVDVVKDNLEQARSAGLITKAVEQRIGQNLPQWFSALKDRGYEKDDRLIYSAAPDSVRTVVVAANGKVWVDRTDKEAGAGRVVLASYFAPKSDFREPLLRSLLK